MTEQELNYNGLCLGAKAYARKNLCCKWAVDWRDLAQEAALKKLRGLKNIDGAMLDYVRRLPLVGRYRKKHFTAAECCSLNTALHVVADVSAMPMTRSVEEAIKSLPPLQQRVLYLRYWQDMDREAIAIACGDYDPVYIGQLHSTALKTLRSQLQ